MELGRARERRKIQDETRALAVNVFLQGRRLLNHNSTVKSLTGFGTAAAADLFLKSKDVRLHCLPRGCEFDLSFVCAPHINVKLISTINFYSFNILAIMQLSGTEQGTVSSLRTSLRASTTAGEERRSRIVRHAET